MTEILPLVWLAVGALLLTVEAADGQAAPGPTGPLWPVRETPLPPSGRRRRS